MFSWVFEGMIFHLPVQPNKGKVVITCTQPQLTLILCYVSGGGIEGLEMLVYANISLKAKKMNFFAPPLVHNVPQLNAVGDLEHKCLNLKIKQIWNTEI